MYAQMYTVRWVLSITLAVGCLAAVNARAQVPQQVPPKPKAKVEGPAGPPTPIAPQLTRSDAEAWLDGYLPYALQRADIAGAVVVVVKDGEILLEKGYGYADVERHVPVDPQHTLFRPGSVSKLFTWTAVMQQVERGKLDLDRDVNQYLDFKIPNAFGRPVTLRNIMTHTAGFEEVDKNLFTNDSVNIESFGAFLKAWTPTRIFPPGQVPAYSNYATTLAGYIVERVSGEPFNDYIEHHIFSPLGMEHATFRQPLPDRIKTDMAKGYEVASGPSKPYEVVIAAPAGSLAASGHDMGRFMIAHLQNGRLGSAEILKPETAKLMHGTALTTISPQLNRMVLGFYETNRNGRRAIAHGGDTYWFHSDLHLFIDDGVGIYISMNSAGKDGATSAVRSALFEQFADRYLPGETSDGHVDPKVAMEHARLMAGHYDNSRRSETNFLSLLGLMGQAKVTINEDSTISLSLLDGLNGKPKKWRETAPFVWREVDGKNWLAAKVQNGKVVMFSGDEISPFMMFLPAPWWKSSVWLLVVLEASLVALALTVVMWPVALLVRRHYRVASPLTGRDALAHRWARIAAAAVLVVTIAWGVTISRMSADISALSSKLDVWLWMLELLSLIVFLGAAVVAIWSAWMVWTATRTWPAKVWSAVVGLACVMVLYGALAYHLIGFKVDY
jgi:CubicO group peptidase (beta-lactamase class C family)